jgi:type III secretion protein Q
LNLPFTYPRLRISESKALKTLTANAQGIDMPGMQPGDAPARLRLTAVPMGHAIPSTQLKTRIQLEWAGARLLLDLSEAAHHHWLRASLGGVDYAPLPDGWRQAILTHAGQWLCERLERLGRGQVLLEHIDNPNNARPQDAPHCFLLDLVMGEVTLQAVLHLDGLALLQVASLWPLDPQTNGPLNTDVLPIAMQICIGQTTLPIMQLRRLQVGGLVFIQQLLMDGEQTLQLRSPTHANRYWSIPAQLSTSSLTILGPAITMNDVALPQDTTYDELPDIEQLPMKLTFDLGEQTMTLAHLRELNTGHTLALTRSLGDGVTIRANGVVIGNGNLVDIDGRFGVLVTHLSTPSGPTPSAQD